MQDKLNQNKQHYDKELEDELASLEAQLEGDDDEEDEQDENMSLDELERQIQEMSDDEGTSNKKPVQQQPVKKETKNWPFSVPLNKMQILEKNFHGFELFFGETLENERNKIIPNFKEKLQDEDDAIDFILFLEQKNGKLVAMQKTVEQKVMNQQMSQEEYLKCLNGFLSKNLQILKIVQSKKVGQFDEARIKKRIQIYQEEIKNVEEAIKDQISEISTKQESQISNKKDIKKQKTKESIQKEEDQSKKKEDNQKQVEDEKDDDNLSDQAVEDKELQKNEVYVYLKSKKTLFVALLEYFITHMQEQRKQTIEKYKKTLEQIDKYIVDFQEGKKVPLDKKEIDVKFPNPKKIDIIGMTDQQRQEKVSKIASQIKNDMEKIKKENPKLFQSLTKYYQNFFANLKKVQESSAPFPIIEKKQVPISCKTLNKELDRGQISVNFLHVKAPKQNRVFFLRYWIQYKGKEQGFETPCCEKGGKMTYSKVIELDNLGLREKYIKEAILILHIFKRKYMAFHRHICRRQITLEPVVDYATKKLTVKFDYKDGKTLDVDFEIKLRKAISQTPKADLELFTFVKTFPAFSLQNFRRGSSIQNQQQQQQKRAQSRPSSIQKQTVDTTEVQNDIKQEQSIKKQLNPNQSNIYKFLFPIMTDQEYNLLKVVVAKCKLNHAYLDYDTKIFCVSFLEKYKADLEKQAKHYNEELDMDMMKKANERLLKADQYLNYLENNIGSGKMSTEQYKSMIEGYLQMDQNLKKVFEKMKQIKGITFVSNRIALIEEELKQFDDMPEEQLKKKY